MISSSYACAISQRAHKESLTGTLNAHKAFLDLTEPMVEVQAAQASSCSSSGQSAGATTTASASVTSASPFGPGPTGPTGPSASPFGGGTRTPSPFAAAQATSPGPVASSPFAQPAGPFAPVAPGPVATGDGRSVSPFAATGQVSWSESNGSFFFSRDWTKTVTVTAYIKTVSFS